MKKLILGFLLTLFAFPARAQQLPDHLPVPAQFCNHYEQRKADAARPGGQALAADEAACVALCDHPETWSAAAVHACESDTFAHAQFVQSAAGGGAAVPFDFVPVITDFFVARLKAELMTFLQNEVAGEVCNKDSKLATDALLVNSCAILNSSDGSIATLPAALKRDFDALPATLPPFVLQVAGKLGKFSADAQKVVCVALITPPAYRALKSDGAIKALDILAKASRPEPECTDIVQHVNVVAAWLRDQVSAAPDKTKKLSDLTKAIAGNEKTLVLSLTAIAVTAAAGNALPASVKADLAKVEARLKDIEPLVADLISLIREYSDGNHGTDVVDQMADKTMRIVAMLSGTSDDVTTDLLSLGQAVADFSTGRYWPGVLELISIKTFDDEMSKNDATKKLWKAFTTWGNLLAGLATAKSADDAQKILEAAAAPVGSYKEFRADHWRGFISGYGGITVGWDDPLDGGKSSGTVAPFLPIGLEVGHGIGRSCSFNALVSLIDVGALAVTRFDDDSKENMGMNGEIAAKPEQSFRSVFAPGAFIGFGLGKTPFVLGGGVEWLPSNVRRFACTAGVECSDTVTTPTVRMMLFLAVDITAFPVF